MRTVSVLMVAVACLFLASVAEAEEQYVNGYYRSDGTYVQGHWRTTPDSSPYNNYSYPGNYNPNTGRISSGDPYAIPNDGWGQSGYGQMRNPYAPYGQ